MLLASQIIIFAVTVDLQLSEPQRVSNNGKSVQISELFAQLRPIHAYREHYLITLIEHSLVFKIF